MKIKKIIYFLVLCIVSTLFFGCTRQTVAQNDGYEGRVFYEIFVRSFKDSNGDGKGDIKGITQKLDYIKGLGVKGIWLTPINSSPSYHGYDVSDYYKINPEYGTMDDFKELIKEAHKEGIMVLMDLVMNHTSLENQWFKEASKDKNSKFRDYYIWADKNTDVNEMSSINTFPWTKLNDDYYYSIFWSGMPDLNYDNSAVRDEMKKVAKFYLDMGVDGFRLDAAMHIYKESDKNVQWWKEFNDYVKAQNKNAVLLGEVWSNTKTIAPYFKGLDSTFNFPLGDAIINMVNSSNGLLVSEQIKSAYEYYDKFNKNYIDSPFLTNHDMDRVANKCNGDSDKMKKAAAILLTLPGTPFIYYGEETGMMGGKPDEKIREPFIWDNKDKAQNTSWEPINNVVDDVAVNIEQSNKGSILNFYKQMIAIRNNSEVLKHGNFGTIESDEASVFAFKRTLNNDSVYVLINLGDKSVKQSIDLKNAKVIYSNKRKDKKLKFNGNVNLIDGEILIIEK
ncbi:alpha-amylase family glycosyl hydrolase [Clostridium omnivorum]|uniref:Alpha-amylase n=1 Tax=Clostridium omnivorum TaxID=1604902 RepID=A0ABQ5N235_9CLOT|nr:alpha-amylase family glycosyl hydrolase [Clostridium sp. E14]GLC29262.1 alpha-amylase [Clostridium sp. E14]